MLQDLWNKFVMFFPTFAEDTVEYFMNDYYELVVKLNNGNCFIFDPMDETMRRIPKDSNNLTEEEYRNEFSIRLYKMMRRRGLTQNDLMALTGITQAMLSRYMSGKATPSSYNISKLARALECSTDDLCIHKYF